MKVLEFKLHFTRHSPSIFKELAIRTHDMELSIAANATDDPSI